MWAAADWHDAPALQAPAKPHEWYVPWRGSATCAAAVVCGPAPGSWSRQLDGPAARPNTITLRVGFHGNVSRPLHCQSDQAKPEVAEGAGCPSGTIKPIRLGEAIWHDLEADDDQARDRRCEGSRRSGARGVLEAGGAPSVARGEWLPAREPGSGDRVMGSERGVPWRLRRCRWAAGAGQASRRVRSLARPHQPRDRGGRRASHRLRFMWPGAA